MRTKLREVPATIRIKTTKGARRRLRQAGLVPAVVYGRGLDPALVTVDQALFTRTLPQAVWHSTPLQLLIADDRGRNVSHTVMIADVQSDIVSRRIISADFHVVSLQEKVHAQVPVFHVGELAAEMKGGIVDHIAREVSVEAFPTDIPEHLEVDISGLAIGDNIKIKDLALPEGVVILHSPDDVVLVIAAPAKPVEAPRAEPEAHAISETAEPRLVRSQEEE